MNLPNLPAVTRETIRAMEDMTFFTHALIFDDLLIVAQRDTNCFVLRTQAGLIVIDAIWPAKQAFDAIIAAIVDVGWRPADLKKLVLTHGHVDHTGCGKWLVQQYGVETCLSQVDDCFWRDCPAKPARPETWKDYEIDHYLQDGERLVLGEKEIEVVSTPGHTPGCLSYLFDVTENGKTYKAALWGGTTPPRDAALVPQYLQSLRRFTALAKRRGVTVALSNHTAIDSGLQRIAYAQKRLAYLPNIYIVGEEGFLRYCEVFRTMCKTGGAE